MNMKYLDNKLADLEAIDSVVRWTAKEQGIKYGTKAYDELFKEVWSQLKDVA